MDCPQCDSSETGVKETRSWNYGWLRRKRYCKSCNLLWSTLEIPEDQVEIEPITGGEEDEEDTLAQLDLDGFAMRQG